MKELVDETDIDERLNVRLKTDLRVSELSMVSIRENLNDRVFTYSSHLVYTEALYIHI